jgi:hypothetical protein
VSIKPELVVVEFFDATILLPDKDAHLLSIIRILSTYGIPWANVTDKLRDLLALNFPALKGFPSFTLAVYVSHSKIPNYIFSDLHKSVADILAQSFQIMEEEDQPDFESCLIDKLLGS